MCKVSLFDTIKCVFRRLAPLWLAICWAVIGVSFIGVLVLERADASEVLRLGNDGSVYPPFYAPDPSGVLKGFEIDLAQAMCAAVGAECRFVIVPWDNIIDALVDRKIDAIVSSMSITEERKKRISFSEHYYVTSVRFVVRKDSGVFGEAPDSLRGRRVGSQDKTVFADYLRNVYSGISTVVLFDGQPETNQALIDGRVDAILAESINLWNFLRTPQGACCVFHGAAIRAWTDEVGVALRKEDVALRERFNRAIARIIANGTYEEINTRYLPFSIY
ncbi:polar amino acid transport system substrate-binding protein [Azospirillaceae bacterium]